MANPSPNSSSSSSPSQSPDQWSEDELLFPIDDINDGPSGMTEEEAQNVYFRQALLHANSQGRRVNITASGLSLLPGFRLLSVPDSTASGAPEFLRNSSVMAANGFQSFSSGNEDIVTSIHFNLYGTRQVTASSDKTIKVFDDIEGIWSLIDTWTAHDAEVLDAKWGKPYWGEIIGSIGEDMKFKVWHENAEEVKNSGHRFQCIYSHTAPAQVPYVSLDFRGKNYPSHDTTVALLSRTGYLELYEPVDNEAFNAWQRVDAFHVCTPPPRGEETGFKVCFNPDPSPSWNAIMAGLPKDGISLVVAAMNEAKVYRTDSNHQYYEAITLTGHRDLLRDVSWAPNGQAKGFDLIATACKDGRIRIFQVDTPHTNTDSSRAPTAASAPSTSNRAKEASSNAPSMIGAGLAGASGATGASRAGNGAPGRVKHQSSVVAELATHGGEVWKVKFDRFGRLKFVPERSLRGANISAIGSLLASAGDDGNIRMWKRATSGEWLEYSDIYVDTV
ncbi:MAG: hypothetical protein M1812_003054 [Candelaria pacifica]|nr:MAG: hypothetical protein M1812_003054 [Candelaria pacifica]